VVEAKRTPAPLCIKIFVLGKGILIFGLRIEVFLVESGTLDRMGRTLEENCHNRDQQLSRHYSIDRLTCLTEGVFMRRLPLPMVWLDQRSPLLGIILCDVDKAICKNIS